MSGARHRSPPAVAHWWLLVALAAASFVPLLLRVQYSGEEAVYAVEAYEQWFAQDWLRPTFLGSSYQRPPLYTDLIRALSPLLGWGQCLAAARLVSSLATVLSGLLVAAFIRRVGSSAGQAAFTAVVFLTLSEPLFYYGWLGYSDALFGMLTLAAMLGVRLAVRERRVGWLFAGLLCADAAFLTKALTAYVFAGVAGLASLWHDHARAWLRRPGVWVAALLPLVVPALWYGLAPSGGTMAHGMVSDITDKLGQQGVAPYLRHFAQYPLHAALNLLPAAGVALWVTLRQGRHAPGHLAAEARLAGSIALVNFLPYWLAPQSGARYLMPLYGLAAVWLAGVLWDAPSGQRLLWRWAAAAIVVKWLAALWLFPAYTDRVRPDLAAIARQVDSRAAGHPLYADTDAWIGISVVALHDTAQDAQAPGQPRKPLQRPPTEWTDALVLSDHDTTGAPPSRLVADYGGVRLYCRGKACD